MLLDEADLRHTVTAVADQPMDSQHSALTANHRPRCCSCQDNRAVTSAGARDIGRERHCSSVHRCCTTATRQIPTSECHRCQSTSETKRFQQRVICDCLLQCAAVSPTSTMRRRRTWMAEAERHQRRARSKRQTTARQRRRWVASTAAAMRRRTRQGRGRAVHGDVEATASSSSLRLFERH